MNDKLTIKDMTRLIKMLKQGQRNEIGLVNKANGSSTQSP